MKGGNDTAGHPHRMLYICLLLAAVSLTCHCRTAEACSIHTGPHNHPAAEVVGEQAPARRHLLELAEDPVVIEYEEVPEDFVQRYGGRRLLSQESSQQTLDHEPEVREQPGPRCGSRPISKQEHIQISQHVSQVQAAAATWAEVPDGMMTIQSVRPTGPAPFPLNALSVSLYFHVISGSTPNTTVYAPPELLAQQVEIMNAAYNPHSIRFVLRGVTRVQSEPWSLAEINGPSETSMKTKLRRGNVQDLNIYLIRPASGTLGWSTFPWETTKLGMEFDGVVVHVGTLPGGSMHPYNKGYTIVHEVGHWLGLLHVFENGCGTAGDSVDDTPAQASAAYGCPLERDTCPGTGRDPVQNYMGYTDDSCMTGFTTGQGQRILAMWQVYRGAAETVSNAARLQQEQAKAPVQLPSGTTYGMSMPIRNDNGMDLSVDPAAQAAAAQQAAKTAGRPPAAPAVITAKPAMYAAGVKSSSSSSSSSSGGGSSNSASKGNSFMPPPSSNKPNIPSAPKPIYIQSRPAAGSDVLDMQATLLAAMMNLGAVSVSSDTNPSPQRSMALVPAVGQEQSRVMPSLAQSKRRSSKLSVDNSKLMQHQQQQQQQHKSNEKPTAAGLANQRIAKPVIQRKQRASAHEIQKQAADK